MPSAGRARQLLIALLAIPPTEVQGLEEWLETGQGDPWAGSRAEGVRVAGERDRLRAELAQVTEQRDVARKEWGLLVIEIDELRAERDRYWTQLADAREAALFEVRAVRDRHVRDDLDIVVSERDRYRAQLADAVVTVTAAADAHRDPRGRARPGLGRAGPGAALIAERDRLRAQLAAAAELHIRPLAIKLPTISPAELAAAIAEERRAPPLLRTARSEDHDALRAEHAAALDDLAALVRILRRDGGYLPPEDQAALRAAMARLEASGRSVER